MAKTNKTSNKISTVGRRAIILEKLELEKQVDVLSLSKQLGVSEVTIRNDLSRLEKKNILIRARGGAIKVDNVGADFNISDKNKQHFKEKQRIGRVAAELIEDGDTIILDSGTTTMEIARNLEDKADLTVITNALNIAILLAELKGSNIIIPGGFLRRNSLSLIGATADDNFKNYFCDKLFLAVDGFNSVHGLSTPNVEEAHLNRVMIDISRQVIVVADSSKFQRRSLAFIAPVEKVDILVTDSGIDPEEKKRLENAGVKVIIA